MAYSLDIHPDVVEDITEISRYLSSRELGLGDDFVIAVDDSLDLLERELQNNFLSGRRFEGLFARSIIGSKASPSYAKKFKKYYLWYEINDTTGSATIYAVAFAGRHRDSILQMIKDRSGE